MSENVIETQDLTVYYGEHRGIKDVDLTVEKGKVFGFHGPNGAGKTTTQRVLLNVFSPTQGKATIFALALFFFQHRRLTVGAWPWQQGKVEA